MSDITKRALEKSLKNMMEKKPLNKVTINEITEDCGINRMTFYYHFRDIYDLVEWSCLRTGKMALKGSSTHDTWKEGLLKLFHAALENKQFVTNIYRNIDRERTEKYLTPLTENLLMRVLNEEPGGVYAREEDKEFIAKTYAYVFIGFLLDWIKNNMAESPEKIVEKLSVVVQGTFSGALSRFENR